MKDLEFYGVMRFFYADSDQKVATKCLRVSSTATTSDVIANLVEKFRPDIRMLTAPKFALFEVHANCKLLSLGYMIFVETFY